MLEEETCAGNAQVDVIIKKHDQCASSANFSSPSSKWCTVELKDLADAINAALQDEGLCLDSETISEIGMAGLSGTEPESEASPAAEVVPVGIERLRQAIIQQVVSPLLETRWPACEDAPPPLQQLPQVVDQSTLLLKKTWRLACARAEQTRKACKERSVAEAEVEKLCERLSREEAGRLAAEAESGTNESVPEVSDSAMQRLTVARKTIKEKEWELVEARRRVDHLERERTTQDKRIRDLETALQRHVHAQSEAERRCSEVHFDADAEAAQQRSDLRRQLASAELARERAEADAMALARQAEEERIKYEQRLFDLESKLSESRVQLEESHAARESLDEQLRRSKEKRSSAVTPQRSRPELSETPQREQPTEQKAPRQSVGGVLPRSGFGVAAKPPPRPRRSEASSKAHQERCQAAASDGEDEEHQPQSLSRPASLQAIPNMPTDLKSLGKMLAGSGVTKSRSPMKAALLAHMTQS